MVDGREDGPADVSKATEDYPGINLSLSLAGGKSSGF